jgi:peroxiredoxin
MARTQSSMMALGTAAPDFNLEDAVHGQSFTLQRVRGTHGLLVMFICRHCPFVKHLDAGLGQLGRDYDWKKIGIVAISSNDAKAFPEDGPASLKDQAIEHRFVFPYLYHETQEVARAYDAQCTPDFFLFDSDLKLAYRGQFDGSRPGNSVPVTGDDLRAAINALLGCHPVSREQIPSIGCSIKWK